MTKWVEAPLRPQGQPWPGLNTSGGKLDPGAGFLEDGSVNAIINEADILEKRRGFIRGIDERFSGVVCGLFRYTDDCGVEYLVVADEAGISIRTPFDIPTFLGSDTFPIDNFDSLDTTRWSNTTDYEVEFSSLVLNDLADASTSEFVEASRLMQWFKAASLTSYQIEIEYAMSAGEDLQVASAVIKRNGNSYLQANVFLNGAVYRATLQIVVSGTRTTLAQADLGGIEFADGFLQIAYDATTRTVSARIVPTGGSIESLSAILTEIQEDSLGQNSAIGLSFGGLAVLPVAIRSVTGGAI